MLPIFAIKSILEVWQHLLSVTIFVHLQKALHSGALILMRIFFNKENCNGQKKHDCAYVGL